MRRFATALYVLAAIGTALLLMLLVGLCSVDRTDASAPADALLVGAFRAAEIAGLSGRG